MTEQEMMLLEVSNLLDKYNVKHCLMFGTLLGVVRDNKLIEWDKDDIDLGIFEQFWKNDELWYRFLLDLRDRGLRIKDMSYNYVCIAKCEENNNLHTDLYFVEKGRNDYFIKVTGKIAGFPLEDFDSLDKIKFLEKDFNVPHNVENHLKNNYGENWKIPTQSDWEQPSVIPINNYQKITYPYIVSVEEISDKEYQKQILLDISNLLDEYKIANCLMFGTLLGAVRDNDFIEYLDLDLGIFYPFWKDDKLWYKFNLDLEKLGYRIFGMTYNIVWIEFINKPNTFHIDLFWVEKDEKEYFVKSAGKIVHFKLEAFDSFDELEFCGKKFKIPHNVKAHLERNYGKDWRIPSKEDNWNERTPLNNVSRKMIRFAYEIWVEQ